MPIARRVLVQDATGQQVLTCELLLLSAQRTVPTLLTFADPAYKHQTDIAALFRAARDVVYRKSTAIERAISREVSRFSGVDALPRFAVREPVVVESVRASVNLADTLFLSYDQADALIYPMLLFYAARSLPLL